MNFQTAADVRAWLELCFFTFKNVEYHEVESKLIALNNQ